MPFCTAGHDAAILTSIIAEERRILQEGGVRAQKRDEATMILGADGC